MEGKIIPKAIDLEQAVLGAMLVDSKAVDETMETNMSSKVFHEPKHQHIFAAIESMYLRNEPPDLLTVSHELKSKGTYESVGGDYYLIELAAKVSSGAHQEFHCRILMQKFMARELIKNSTSIIKDAYSDGLDCFDLLDKAYSHLGQISDLLISNKEISVRELTADILDYSKRLHEGKVKPGIETPIKNLTKKMGGWRDSELIIIAGRPGMGKTAFALKAGWEAAKKDIPVGFFSLEMSDNQLLTRCWSMECKIENDKFTKIGLNDNERKIVSARSSELREIPFYIDDDSNLTIRNLSVKAKKWKKEKGIKLIIIDYLQLMNGTSNGNSREQDISTISRGLKLIAKELNIPVIALSQLSRAVETRGGSKRPLLSDLRESGAIEQDADVVQFIYRPEYYGIKEWDDYDKVPCADQAEYIIAKNRNGGLVRNRMRFEGKYTNFSDLDYNEFSNLNFQNQDDEPF